MPPTEHNEHLDRLHTDQRRTRLIFGAAIIIVTVVTTYLYVASTYPQPTSASVSPSLFDARQGAGLQVGTTTPEN